ncbi:uncharacterized protein B0H18DRAFT_1120596 [Fomitopsis serialis]|uniref:uncharacterized protein n=1 Tax=Fomitopsis serialis TaxID=139415 RepID=UPI002007D1AB|nr:uncharacterized protein B0H18DRAFT_1120596 [Neoantrodia serialis]KAH9923073.1 hypothetical protein B0H18DRAFT_1120596 [Neoantrodia serialis]
MHPSSSMHPSSPNAPMAPPRALEPALPPVYTPADLPRHPPASAHESRAVQAPCVPGIRPARSPTSVRSPLPISHPRQRNNTRATPQQQTWQLAWLQTLQGTQGTPLFAGTSLCKIASGGPPGTSTPDWEGIFPFALADSSSASTYLSSVLDVPTPPPRIILPIRVALAPPRNVYSRASQESQPTTSTPSSSTSPLHFHRPTTLELPRAGGLSVEYASSPGAKTKEPAHRLLASSPRK